MRHFYTPSHEAGGRLLPDIRPYSVVRCTKSARAKNACNSAVADASDDEWWDNNAAAAGETWGEHLVRKQVGALTGCAVVLDDSGPRAANEDEARALNTSRSSTLSSDSAAEYYVVEC